MGDQLGGECRPPQQALHLPYCVLYRVLSPRRCSAGRFVFFLFLKGRQQGKERLSSLGNFLLYFYFCFCFFNLEEGTDYKGLK